MSAWTHMCYVYVRAHGGQGTGFPGTGVLSSYETPGGCWEANPDAP